MKDKKLIVSTIVGVTVFVVLIFGATYAYFTINATNNFGTKDISASINDIGSVAIKSKNDLKINLTVSDMMQAETDVVYYASKNGKTTTETTEIIGETSVTGPGMFSCSYKMTLDDNESSMYDAFQAMETKSEGQIVLTVNGETYDFNTEGLFPKTIDGTITSVSSATPQHITAQLKIVNKKDVLQTALAGTNIEVSVKIEDFTCSALPVENPVLAIQSENLSKDLVGGMFRFQGTAEDVTDNYFCFADSLENCVANQDMYAIILGITPEGQVKMMMPFVGIGSWHGEEVTGITWPNSILYAQLQEVPDSLSESFNVDISALLEDYNWKYGDITDEDMGFSENATDEDLINAMSADNLARIEGGWTNKIQSKVGLMYAHDYFYQVKGGKCLYWDEDLAATDQYGDGLTSRCIDTWLAGFYAWTMASNSEIGEAYAISDGFFYPLPITTAEIPYIPVVYLKAGLDIIGEGTLDNPYRIAPTATE